MAMGRSQASSVIADTLTQQDGWVIEVDGDRGSQV